MIALDTIAGAKMRSDPYRWSEIAGLYAPDDAARLAATFPRDHYKRVASYNGEKDYDYEARPLIAMGAASVSYAEALSPPWRALAADLLSAAYRDALSALTSCDLRDAQLEVNVFHYGPGAELGPHADLPEKIVTHVLYFNEAWNAADGGCLTILRAKDETAIAAEILPIAGNSAVLVRSDDSWHAVKPVVASTRQSRRSLTATFYRPDAVSSMWPPGTVDELRDYDEPRWKSLLRRAFRRTR